MKLYSTAILLSMLGKHGGNANATYCGCNSCTEDVWNSIATDSAGSYTCGDRIDWLQTVMSYSEADACTKVSDEFFNGPCGPVCDPFKCITSPTRAPSTQPITPETSYCGYDTCTQEVWDAPATDSDGTWSCGDRISWLQSARGQSQSQACAQVTLEFPDLCLCASSTPTPSPSNSPTTAVPTKSPTLRPVTGSPTSTSSKNPSLRPSLKPSQMCGCTSCTENVLNSIADGHSCKGRIQWVIENYEYSEAEACKLVADEYPSICGTCHSEHCGSFPPSPTPPPVSGPSLKVMSYNTEYSGYWDGRFDNFAAHIKSINADLVGLQECQNAQGIADKSGYKLLAPSNGNTVLYNSDLLQAIANGEFNIPRDDYAQRTIAWGKFRFIQGKDSGKEFLYFNTHLPHNHNEAADRNTHSIIANMLLDKRNELGSGATIVTGDCNPFASSGASKGSFESNLAAGGIALVYMANGSTGGYAGLDKIFASEGDWVWTNAKDVGTGSSDHPAIAADLTLLN